MSLSAGSLTVNQTDATFTGSRLALAIMIAYCAAQDPRLASDGISTTSHPSLVEIHNTYANLLTRSRRRS